MYHGNMIVFICRRSHHWQTRKMKRFWGLVMTKGLWQVWQGVALWIGDRSFYEAIKNVLWRREKGSEVSEARVLTRQASSGIAWLLYWRGRLWWSPFRSYQLNDSNVSSQIYEGSNSTTSKFCDFFWGGGGLTYTHRVFRQLNLFTFTRRGPQNRKSTWRF